MSARPSRRMKCALRARAPGSSFPRHSCEMATGVFPSASGICYLVATPCFGESSARSTYMASNRPSDLTTPRLPPSASRAYSPYVACVGLRGKEVRFSGKVTSERHFNLQGQVTSGLPFHLEGRIMTCPSSGCAVTHAPRHYLRARWCRTATV